GVRGGARDGAAGDQGEIGGGRDCGGEQGGEGQAAARTHHSPGARSKGDALNVGGIECGPEGGLGLADHSRLLSRDPWRSAAFGGDEGDRSLAVVVVSSLSSGRGRRNDKHVLL